MLEILKFVTSGFWTFVGSLIFTALLGTIMSDLVIELFKLLKTRRNENSNKIN